MAGTTLGGMAVGRFQISNTTLEFPDPELSESDAQLIPGVELEGEVTTTPHVMFEMSLVIQDAGPVPIGSDYPIEDGFDVVAAAN